MDGMGKLEMTGAWGDTSRERALAGANKQEIGRSDKIRQSRHKHLMIFIYFIFPGYSFVFGLDACLGASFSKKATGGGSGGEG